MGAAIMAITIGGIFVFSALKGISVKDVLAGVTGNPLSPSGHSLDIPDSLGGVIDGSTNTLTPLNPNTGSGKFPQSALLKQLADAAQSQFKLRITSTTGGNHVAGSYHYKGRAFDASGSESDMRAFSEYVTRNYATQVAELIHNPGYAIKNGQVVSPLVYAATWASHRDHVHLAV